MGFTLCVLAFNLCQSTQACNKLVLGLNEAYAKLEYKNGMFLAEDYRHFAA